MASLAANTRSHLRTSIPDPAASTEVINILEGTVDITFTDDDSIVFGTGLDAEIMWSTGDASDHSVVFALGDTSQMLHISDVGAKATDWNITSPTHPTVYIHSNTTPITDYLLIGGHDGTTANIEAVGGTLNLTAVTEVVINEASADVNFRVESNALANFLLVDAAECLNGTLSIGAAAPTNPQCMLGLLPPANATGVTASQSYFHGQILPGGATTIPAGTAPVVASLNIHEPNITATGTVTAAATVRIVDAPTEGSTNWALWVDAGAVRIDERLNIGGTAADAQLTTGIIINQGAADNNVISLKSSDVAHGMTTDYETDTYGAILKFAGADGGLKIVGLSDVTVAVEIFAASVTEETTDPPTTATTATLTLNAAVKSGTTFGALAATANLLNVENLGTAEFVVKGDGELYSNQSATVGTFDEYNDAVMCADLSYVLSHEYAKVTEYNRETLERAGILSPGGMYSVTKMNMLAICAIGQIGRQINALAQHVGLDFNTLPGGVNLLPGNS